MSGQKTGQITVAAVGRIKQREWRTLQDDYLERLKRYTAMNIAEVKDSVGKGFPDAVAMQREGEALLSATADARRRFLLSPDGRQMSSEEFAEYLQQQIELYGSLAFLVGGPLGFAPDVETAVDDRLALSRLTFPHELARVMFLEQLYRAFTILRGQSYHK
jgi:23S rRNA (pseudouridine1915-N3)-methyltransferase